MKPKLIMISCMKIDSELSYKKHLNPSRSVVRYYNKNRYEVRMLFIKIQEYSDFPIRLGNPQASVNFLRLNTPIKLLVIEAKIFYSEITLQKFINVVNRKAFNLLVTGIYEKLSRSLKYRYSTCIKCQHINFNFVCIN
jgi:hypothetical protein